MKTIKHNGQTYLVWIAGGAVAGIDVEIPARLNAHGKWVRASSRRLPATGKTFARIAALATR